MRNRSDCRPARHPSTPAARLTAAFRAVAGVVFALALVAPAASASAPADRAGFRKLLDAVVRIDVRETSLADGSERIIRGTGSGVIVSETGDILTNAHVVGPRAVEIMVTLSSLERVRASFVGWDHWTDLAVVRLDVDDVAARKLRFAVARLGDSSRLRPGDEVFAVGTPNGLTRTVTRGIVSNTNRYFEESNGVRGYETGQFNTWLQTDAAINPGNSGGPLVDGNGLVVGINTRGYLGANNLGFAVPASTVREVLPALLAEGKVTRADLGLRLAPLQDLESFFNLAVNEGVLIPHVDPGSPADRAGIRPGDILIAVDGQAKDGRFPEQLPGIQHGLAVRPVGAMVKLLLQRGERRFEVEAVTEKLESRVGEQGILEAWGLSVEEVSRAVARELTLPEAAGVRILGVQPGFPAAEAGLRRGDVIMRVNRRDLRTLPEATEADAKFAAEPSETLVEVRRGTQTVLVVVRPR